MPGMFGTVAGNRRRSAAVAFGPRLVPGVAGAVSSPTFASQPTNTTRLAAGTYTALSVAADTLVLPEIGTDGSDVIVRRANMAAGSILYGVTVIPNPAADGWCADVNAASQFWHCDFDGDPSIEHIRFRVPGVEVHGCRFTGTPAHHSVKVFGVSGGTGAGVVADSLFESTPVEDYIQMEGAGDTLIEHNAFAGAASEDCIDTKEGGAGVNTIRGHDFTSSAMAGEALLSKNPNGDVITDNRFGSGCFHSFGAGDEVVATGESRRNIYQAGSTLRLRKSNGLLIDDCDFGAGTIQVGNSSPSDDFPTDAEFQFCDLTGTTITVPNTSSTTITHDNTYSGVTGAFPSGNN